MVRLDTIKKAVEIIVIIATVFNTFSVVSINKELDWRRQDFSILQEFQKAYADENTRGLALRYLKLIKDNDTQTQTRLFVTWDLLRRVVKKESYLGKTKYRFNGNDDNCYYLVENLNEFSEINKKNEAFDLFNGLILNGPNIYKDYSSKKQFYLLLSWIADRTNIIKAKLPKESFQMVEHEMKSN